MSTRSTPKCSASIPSLAAGFTFIELLMGVALMSIAVAATSGMFVAGKHHMATQQRQIETTEVARAAIDMIVRDLRLGGACLPVTGDFIALEGIDTAQKDEIVTRTGLTRPDLSCIRTSVPIGSSVAADGSSVPVGNSEGFAAGMRVYIRHPDGAGEYFDVSSIGSATELRKSQTLSRDYPDTSGVYAIDERRFYLADVNTSAGTQSELLIQVGSAAPQSFAVGIEELDIHYQLQRNCPPCDVIDVPAANEEWTIVDSVLLNVTARSQRPDQSGTYYRRTVAVNVKPRNLLPR